MAVAILIGLWISDELSFNRYHKNYDRIVKVMDHQGRYGQKNTNDALPIPLGAAIQSAYLSDFKYITMVRETEEHILAAGNKEFTQAGNYMQPKAPEMFSLEMIHGSGENDHAELFMAGINCSSDRIPGRLVFYEQVVTNISV